MRRIRQNIGSPGFGFKLMEASLVHGFTSEPVKKGFVLKSKINRGVFTCSILASIVMILTSIKPILEKGVFLQV